MRHPRTTIAIIGVAAIAGVSGIVAATAGGSAATASSKAPSGASKGAVTTPVAMPAASNATGTTNATVHTLSTAVTGKTETVLVDAEGLPLYFYKPDTATKSFVSGSLASLWPPLTTTNAPTLAGASGKISVSNANGHLVAYNGHFLYTFVGDSAGHVSGQGVQDFFVATPRLGAIAPSSPMATATPTPAPSSGGSYGY